MARYRKMIKIFLFEEPYRREMSDLSSGVRLNPSTNRLELQMVGGSYPTTTNLLARTRLFSPDCMRKWGGFFVIGENIKYLNQVVTAMQFRLCDGIDDYYWDSISGDWLVASANDWNTEQEIADHIDTYVKTSLQIVINLSTQKESVTPYISEIRVLYDSDIIFLEDYLVRSFKQDLLENIRPISIFAFKSTGETEKILNMQNPYDIMSIDSVYNHTADPNHLAPLGGTSFDVSTQTLTLPAQDIDDVIHVRFIWRPYIALLRSQDYTEIAKIPVVIFENPSIENEHVIWDSRYVINKGTGNGYSLENVVQANIHIPLRIITPSFRDLHVLNDELERFFSNTDSLRSRGQDEYFSYTVSRNFVDVTVPSQKEVYSCEITVNIENALFYYEDAKPITGVQRFSVTDGNVEFEVTL